jgi:hypothetical protein
MRQDFLYITDLQYKVKLLTARVESFESGEKYVRMRKEHNAQLSYQSNIIKGLNRELADSRMQNVAIRRNFMQVAEDMEKEHSRELKRKETEIDKLKARIIEVERQRDNALDKKRDALRELYEVRTQLEDERGRNRKLKAQIDRDFENSSMPSSQKPSHKKITNSREKTGRKPGGQPGHKGHGRKRLPPTERIHIPEPAEYVNDPNYTPTGRTISKQVVGLHVSVHVREYHTQEFRNLSTGQRVHASFPAGVANDVSYDGSIKAFAFILNNRCCVSIDKVRTLLCEITDGVLEISNGMICGLSKEFCENTKAEQDKALSDLLLSPVMNTDCTNARMGGQDVYVFVSATPDAVIYSARGRKGHKGVEKTPVEDYQGILVHDHEMTFYKYGMGHQECLAHVLRYLKNSMENEPCLEWNKSMHGLLQEMIHTRNNIGPGDIDAITIEYFEKRYDNILALAESEYDYEPPSKYYREGYNLYRRLKKYKTAHLLFLHDPAVPTDNNLSERLLRTFKRKQKQAMSFRSFDSLDQLCRSLGVMASMQASGVNTYTATVDIFDRTSPTLT